MILNPTPRPAEHLHSKSCLAEAVISAVQNLRDTEGETDHEFRLAMQDNYQLELADEYLNTGLQTCTCPPCPHACCAQLESH